ncbi:MAG TPA: glycoside hydrolase family 2 TIM barrel-domain containing protein, partial [Verrucomicrobiae bacterium]|nr:glycoside hydrolase family 2 TIM barrel-domain containing protein [Verrucomicrobiae bacterium]
MKKLAIWTALFFALPIASTALAEKTVYHRTFAPEAGLVSAYEQPWREEICLNGSWSFQADKDTGVPGETVPQLGDWDKTAIKIPSPWNVNSFSMNLNGQGGDFLAYPSYPKEWESVQAAWMKRSFAIPKAWNGKRIVLHFGAVAGDMMVYVNGKKAGEGFDIFFAQDFDVTDLVSLGAENQVLVKVIAPKVFDKRGRFGRREYLSGSFWGTHIAGIWQDVFLLAEPKVSVADVFVQPLLDKNELRVEATIENHSSAPVTVSATGVVREWLNLTGKSVDETPEVKWKLSDKDQLKLSDSSATLAPGESRQIVLRAAVKGELRTWSPDVPNLYGFLLDLSVDGKKADVKYQRFGWRQFTFAGSKLLLNGQPIVLHGDSWHFMGVPQMTRRYACAWFRLLKDAGANSVRLHASVYPSFYHDMADEMGITILDESAIWASDGGPKADSDLFWANCRTHVSELVRRDRNHPSVFGWSVCNEILPVLRGVWHAPQTMVDHCLDEISVWRDICHTNDPTRDWISGDGEFDANGRLATVCVHYGGQEEMRRAAASGKPWGVGETSMAYYGTPKQVSKFNGGRAYESPLGRMEGLAYECYGLLSTQQKYGADYQSVFNIVWYGVQPLPFGKADLTQPPSPDDGIFFGDFLEGVPGMQPERLGPYVSTLNPGYDPSLPLYRPWPMFDAIRDANRGVTNSPWATPPVESANASSSTNGTEVLAYLPQNGSALMQNLKKSGV